MLVKLQTRGGHSLAVNPNHVVKVALVVPESDILITTGDKHVMLMYITGTTDKVVFDTTREATDAYERLIGAIGAAD